MEKQLNTIKRMRQSFSELHTYYSERAKLDGHMINVGITLGLETAINTCDMYESRLIQELKTAYNDGRDAQIQGGDIETPNEYYESNYE